MILIQCDWRSPGDREKEKWNGDKKGPQARRKDDHQKASKMKIPSKKEASYIVSRLVAMR